MEMHPAGLHLDGWTWKRSFRDMQERHDSSDIDTLEKWVDELHALTLSEKWTTGDSHRLVYTNNLEVHNAFRMELDGVPMHIPACVVMSGSTDFAFFYNRKDLHLIMQIPLYQTSI
jgi:hypothetical protein